MLNTKRSAQRPSQLIVKDGMLGDGKNEEKSAKDTENEHSVWKDKEHNCIDLEAK